MEHCLHSAAAIFTPTVVQTYFYHLPFFQIRWCLSLYGCRDYSISL